LHPISRGMLTISLIGGVSFAACWLVQSAWSGYIGLAVGYFVFLVLFLGSCWIFNVIPDATSFVRGLVKRGKGPVPSK
jgi:hypothetical protein